MQKAHVFNIERFATEDGPGIRTVVFLKGCALRCKWCANPESQSFKDEVLFLSNNCINCGKCMEICPQKAISSDKQFGYITNSDICNYCLKCVDNCYADARSPMGKVYTTDELLQEILKDKQYYIMSSGGVTFSGGEPFFQAEAIKEIAISLKKFNISTLVETCGHVALEKIKSAVEFIDYIYYDIKHMDSEKHKKLTGEGNELILQNLKWITQNYKGQLSVRYPYIPGCNDDDHNIRRLFEFIGSLSNIKELVFLPYHRLGLPKYNGLGRSYLMGDMKSLKKNQLQYLMQFGKSYGIKTKIQ